VVTLLSVIASFAPLPVVLILAGPLRSDHPCVRLCNFLLHLKSMTSAGRTESLAAPEVVGEAFVDGVMDEDPTPCLPPSWTPQLQLPGAQVAGTGGFPHYSPPGMGPSGFPPTSPTPSESTPNSSKPPRAGLFGDGASPRLSGSPRAGIFSNGAASAPLPPSTSPEKSREPPKAWASKSAPPTVTPIPETMESGGWACSQCTFLNDADARFCGICATPLVPAEDVAPGSVESLTNDMIEPTVSDRVAL
jgi:hypothetical protein